MVTVLSGHSGSGKSTKAAQLFWQGSAIPCSLITADHFKFKPNTDTTAFFIDLVRMYRDKGQSVIFDGVNLHPLDKVRWEMAFGEELKWISLDTPLDECIRRDSLRRYPVGEAAIRRQGQCTTTESTCDIVKPVDAKALASVAG